MLGDSSVLGSSGEVLVAAGAHEGGEVGGVESNSGEEDKGRVEDGDRSFGGNRWPRLETLALLKIRSDMDSVFRDSNLKGPLWEEVSRKLAELGYNRSAKKCKEKFENVYKYHKRTKEGRSGKHDGKTYRFFDQLEALENHHSLQSLPPPKPQTPVPATAAMPWTNATTISQTSTVPSTTNPRNISVTPTTKLAIPSLPPTNPTILPTQPKHVYPPQTTIPSSLPNLYTNLFSNSTSSSTASDEEFEGRHKKKRKWKDFFKRLTKDVIKKQEELQKKFLEAIEQRENERMVREEAWRLQEMARINREHEILVQERSTAAAKDAAVIAFLQKISEQQNPGLAHWNPLPQPPPPVPQRQAPPDPLPVTNMVFPKLDNGENVATASPSRWPKAEVEALINLRTTLDLKYQENGPKGPLWEEISAGMRKLGYNRSAKRCKEKWENINKYFKKVKESSKKRPEDSKTCPYFHQLNALYKEKNKIDGSLINVDYGVKPDNPMAPLMVRPEQQWPPQQENHPVSVMEDIEKVNMDQNLEQEGDSEEEEEEEEEADDEVGGYEIVTNKPSSMGSGE